MFKALKRWWKYLTAKVSGSFNERADPKVQLEQAIIEAQEQHRRLTEQAANVIANQKQTEMRLNRTMRGAREGQRQRPPGRDHGRRGHRGGRRRQGRPSTRRGRVVRQPADRSSRREVEDLKTIVLQATQASDQAKAAVQQNATALQQKLAERQKLLCQLDQAKMQEQMNTAMAIAVRDGRRRTCRPSTRCARRSRPATPRPRAWPSCTETSVEARMLEVEQATVNVEAQARLAEIRAELGLESAPTPAGAVGAGSAESAATPEPQPPPPSPPSPEPMRRLDRARPRPQLSPRGGGTSTRSSRWTTSWGTSGGQVGGALPATAPQRLGVHGHDAPGEDVARRARPPRPRRRRRSRPAPGDAGGQQRHAPLDERPPGAVVDDDCAR